MTTSIPVGGLHVTPSTRRVSAQPTINVTIQLASTVLITLPTLPAVRNPVILMASVYLAVHEDARMDFQLFRNGAEISALQRFREQVQLASGTTVISMHWYDAEPGISAIYSLRALAFPFAVGNGVATNSRFTAFV